MGQKVLILFIVFTYSSFILAQKPICGSQNKQLKMHFGNPVYPIKNHQRGANTVYEIPIVVHIFHDNDPIGSQYNPDDATIISIIEEAEQRFRHQHPGAKSYTNPYYGIDTELTFCLAKRDATGHETTGIVRYNNSALATGNGLDLITEFLPYTWNSQYFCNIIIMRDLQDACGWYFSSLDATLYDSGCLWSGLVTHELGHYFSLLHTFSSGDCVNDDCDVDGDQVCDTPAKSMAGNNGATSCDSPNNDCQTDEDDPSTNNPYRSVASGGLGEQPDMLANYLDFSSCWDSFTQGQKDRMRANIETRRSRMIDAPSLCADDPGVLFMSHCFPINSNQNNQALTTTAQIQNNLLPTSIAVPIEICIYVSGYIPFAQSIFDIVDENAVTIGQTSHNPTSNICAPSPDVCLTIDPAVYNDWMADGVIDLTFVPTSTFFPFGCGRTEICIQFTISDPACTGDYQGGSALMGVVTMNQAYFSNAPIESQQVITTGGINVLYQSALAVDLFPNFSVEAGSIFQINIGGCQE